MNDLVNYFYEFTLADLKQVLRESHFQLTSRMKFA